MLQRIFMIVVIIAIVVSGGVYAYNQLVPPPAEEVTGPIYSTQPVEKGDLTVGVETTGPLNPSSGGGIRIPGDYRSPSTSYILDEILIKEGDAVKQGDILVKLAAPDLISKIEMAQEELKAARESLASLLNVPENMVDQANPNKGITLRAPIEGRIMLLNSKEGEEVQQGTIVAQIVDDSRFKLVAKLRPQEFKLISKEMVGLLRFGQYSDTMQAKIVEINPNPIPEKSSSLSNDPFAGSDNDNFEFVHWVTLEAENPGLVQPGMEAKIGFIKKEDIKEDSTQNAIWVTYPSKVDGFVNEEKVISSTKGIATEVYVQKMENVKKDDPIISLAGQGVSDRIQEKVDIIRQKKMELQTLQSQKELLEVKAPLDGVVSDIHRQQGETVNAGDWIGNIFQTSDMRMWVQVDDIDILLVKQGAPVEVSVDALPNKTFEGEVEQVSTRGEDRDGVTRFEVFIKVKGSSELRPGMQAKAYIKAGSAKDVLLVPLEAIFQEDGQNKVEILTEDGIPKVVTVEIGLMNDRVAEVKSGLEEGQRVITGSTADLLPSQKIKSNTILPGKSDDNTDTDQNNPGNSQESSK